MMASPRTSTRRCDALSVLAFEAEAVERPGPNMAPTAFRIWRAGANPTDHGMTIFTSRSADLLMAEQAERGNLYAIDVDHLSMTPLAPVEARKAVGWHQLQVRPSPAGPELWAVGVEWTDTVKAGLEKDPPEWRYFSPAYDVNERGEVVRYLKLALTNDPATWNVTALATRSGGDQQTPQKGSPMKKSDLMAALKAVAEAPPEEASARIQGILSTMAEAEAEEQPDAPPPSSDAQPPVEAKPEPEAAPAPEEDRVAAMASRLQALEASLTEMKERTERAKLLASRTDLAKEVRDWLADTRTPIETVRKAVTTLPKVQPTNLAADVTVQATRADTQADPANRTPRSVPEVHDDLMRRMGLASGTPGIQRKGDTVVYGRMSREQAQQILASRKAGDK